MTGIEFKDINFTIDRKDVIKNFNYTIQSGEKIVFNGPSGSGKTSLINMLIGFVQPSSGSIYIDEMELSFRNIKEIRKKISYISQDVDLLNMKVSLFMEEVFKYKVNSEINADEKKIIYLFEKFKLKTDISQKMVGDLSGGERVRLAYVVTKLLDRDILLLDEITAALDEKLKKLIITDVLESEKTALIVSHDRHWIKSDKIRQVWW